MTGIIIGTSTEFELVVKIIANYGFTKEKRLLNIPDQYILEQENAGRFFLQIHNPGYFRSNQNIKTEIEFIDSTNTFVKNQKAYRILKFFHNNLDDVLCKEYLNNPILFNEQIQYYKIEDYLQKLRIINNLKI